MSNNREEGQEDSEYHFSDEEVSYEIESEVPKAAKSSAGQESNIASRFGGKRRMFISAAVFLAIVFVVYKVVSPGTTTPSTELAATAPAPQQQPIQQVAPQQIQTQPAVATQSQQPEVVQPQQAVVQQAQVVQPPSAPVSTLPAVIPVQSQTPAAQSPAAAMGAYIEDKSAELSAASQQAMTQMQSQYTQQFNEFSTQAKSMQGQIQTLSARVADMEAQINQLVQVLTRRNQSASAPPSSSMNNSGPPVQQVRQPEVRIAYNVQAIIPGRAWLKSDNGETLTVAEGDVIRDVGRVTKIDPYDGIVEINTGTKAVSLSYGNGG